MRPLCSIWDLFDKNEKTSVKCKFCAFEYKFSNATRMKQHICFQCKKCPMDIKQRMSENLPQSAKRNVSESVRNRNDTDTPDEVQMLETTTTVSFPLHKVINNITKTI